MLSSIFLIILFGSSNWNFQLKVMGDTWVGGFGVERYPWIKHLKELGIALIIELNVFWLQEVISYLRQKLSCDIKHPLVWLNEAPARYLSPSSPFGLGRWGFLSGAGREKAASDGMGWYMRVEVDAVFLNDSHYEGGSTHPQGLTNELNQWKAVLLNNAYTVCPFCSKRCTWESHHLSAHGMKEKKNNMKERMVACRSHMLVDILLLVYDFPPWTFTCPALLA